MTETYPTPTKKMHGSDKKWRRCKRKWFQHSLYYNQNEIHDSDIQISIGTEFALCSFHFGVQSILRMPVLIIFSQAQNATAKQGFGANIPVGTFVS